jgi:DNA-binding transcriptional ArsR family regulator
VSDHALEEAIRALAHPGRRAMLQLVWDDERPATDLADAEGLSRAAASQHLKLLRDARPDRRARRGHTPAVSRRRRSRR